MLQFDQVDDPRKALERNSAEHRNDIVAAKQAITAMNEEISRWKVRGGCGGAAEARYCGVQGQLVDGALMKTCEEVSPYRLNVAKSAFEDSQLGSSRGVTITIHYLTHLG